MATSEQMRLINAKRQKLRLLRCALHALSEIATENARALMGRLEKRRVALGFELLTDLDTVKASLEQR